MSLRNDILRSYPASNLRPTDQDTIRKLHDENPWIPADYFEFLEHIGWGMIGNSSFMFYGGPVQFEEVFQAPHPSAEILLIGDNLSGYHIGYLSPISLKSPL